MASEVGVKVDGHDTGCTFRKCAHPESAEPCPFVSDVKPPTGPEQQLPAYMPGQVVMVKLYDIRHAVLITDARQNANGSWSYYGLNGGVAFREEHVERLIT